MYLNERFKISYMPPSLKVRWILVLVCLFVKCLFCSIQWENIFCCWCISCSNDRFTLLFDQMIENPMKILYKYCM